MYIKEILANHVRKSPVVVATPTTEYCSLSNNVLVLNIRTRVRGMAVHEYFGIFLTNSITKLSPFAQTLI